ncbi:MAG: hypothetical protein BAA04_11615 [Firmicutes bacterium ZCTH02-B6]|nr:MAG: hypothetical protein BAA04_11615 [Firmicutes bacterium ZCTH02-B6]
MKNLQRFPWLNALVAAVLLVSGWAVPSLAQSGEELVLSQAVTLVPGMEASFVIGERGVQGILERTGFYLDASDEELAAAEQSTSLAVWAHYVVLTPDPATGAPRLQVEAQPIDPDTFQALAADMWRVTYVIEGDQAVRLEGSQVPEEYADLVEPSWLAEWTLTPLEQMPGEALRPGDTWQATPDVDLEDFPYGQLEPVGPLAGTFAGWEDLPELGVRAAYIYETLRGASESRQWVTPLVPGDVRFEVDMASHFWFVPGEFPAQAMRELYGTMDLVVGPSSGAPAGLEGSVTFYVSYEQLIVRLADGVLPAEAAQETGGDVLRRGDVVSGYLGPGSQELEEGLYGDIYELYAAAGEPLTIRLQSADFDAFLALFNDFGEVVAYDDDSGGGTNSLIRFTPPSTGIYWVVVTTFFPGETGRYRLSTD